MTNSEFLSQESNRASKEQLTNAKISKEFMSLCRQAAAEGIVMLKNDGVLPFLAGKLSVFGRVQYNHFYVGEGSGGDVIPFYKVNIIEGLENATKDNPDINYNKELAEIYKSWCDANQPPIGEWGKWPTSYQEMPISEEIIKKASQNSDAAVVIIGRSAGEDRDQLLEPGSYYLTDDELNLLNATTANFEKTIVIINSGNIIDLSWILPFGGKISAVLYAWQGGMESGNAICDVLLGKVSPSGKLPVAVAYGYDKYPSASSFLGKEYNNYVEDIYVGYRYFETIAKDDVLYPFGFGLSYTQFEICAKNGINKVSVKNTGQYDGAEVVQLYYKAPAGKLFKPARALASFAKTKILKQNEEQLLDLSFPIEYMASYDDEGKTGHKSAYVLEPGEYEIFVGSCVRCAVKVASIFVDELKVVQQLSEACPAEFSFERMVLVEGEDGTYTKNYQPVPTRTTSLKEKILANMPKEIKQTGDKGYKLIDVKNGKISMDDFVAQLDLNELEALTRGDYIMDSPLGPKGNAGVFAGITESLRDKGVAGVVTTDGPSGIRLKQYCALLPVGIALASTWNKNLLEKLAEEHGKELTERGSDVLLAPGMNIMRNPLCGRNFEYFSEDPILSGKIAAAVVKGLQKYGKSACPKHFVCNNQETNRNFNDSRLSERALREIYLKGFEICIKESTPKNLMTCYNKVNGVWGHYHYELCTSILRQEWGYEGNIVTDWWMQPSADPHFEALSNDAYRIRAQVDVLMPGGKHFGATDGDGTLLASYSAENGITLAEIQRTAKNVLQFAMELA